MKKKFSIAFWLFPIFCYLLLFIVLTYPAVQYFSSHLFADAGDGLQNLWNLWWVNKAVTELHQSIWQTNYLFAPEGTSLVNHALSPLKGYLAIGFLQVFSLGQTYNALVILTFVLTGFTTFLLTYSLTKSYWASITGGFIFSFSNYHFAHLEGHLNVISFEWIPLFILFWLRFLSRPSLSGGFVSAVSLYTVLLSDYYYFFYSLALAMLLGLWKIWKMEEKRGLYLRQLLLPLGFFILLVVVSAGQLIWPLLSLVSQDSLVGEHLTKEYSLDLLAAIIPGGHWRFADLTKFYWLNLPGNIHETSVHLGLSILILCLFTWRNRKQVGSDEVTFWFISLALFWILSLGPVVQIWGRELSGVMLPYAWLEKVFPLIRLAGVPIRMMMMVTLSVAVISTYGLGYLLRENKGKLGFLFLFIALLFLEYLPKPLTLFNLTQPLYIKLLKNAPDRGVVLDLLSDDKLTLYYQTIHEKPLAGGSLSRIPKSVIVKQAQLLAAVYKKEYKKLCRDFQVRYILTHKQMVNLDDDPSVKILFQDDGIRLYNLGCS